MDALQFVLSSVCYVGYFDFNYDQVRELPVNVYVLGFGSNYCGGIYLVMALILGYLVCNLFWIKLNLKFASLIAWLFSLSVC